MRASIERGRFGVLDAFTDFFDSADQFEERALVALLDAAGKVGLLGRGHQGDLLDLAEVLIQRYQTKKPTA